jgi:hypothetical protein
MRMTDLRPGWAVVGNEDRRIGIVKDVRQDYIVTSRPGFAADLYVPVSAVANVVDETIHLNVRQIDVDQMGWEQRPLADDELDHHPADDLHRHI